MSGNRQDSGGTDVDDDESWPERGLLPGETGTLSFPLAVLTLGVVLVVGGSGVPIPFLAALFAAAAGATVGPLVLRRMRVARSAYAVTDQRIVCVWRFGQPVVTEAGHRSVRPPLVLADGSVFFAPAPGAFFPASRYGGWSRRMRPAAVHEPPNFVGLEDPWSVARLVVEARNALGTATAVAPWRDGR